MSLTTFTEDRIELGPCPVEESAACSLNEPQAHRQQAQALCKQMRRIHPPINDNCRYGLYREPGGNGGYWEVCAFFNINDQDAIDWAFAAEDHVPAEWDDTARNELGGVA